MLLKFFKIVINDDFLKYNRGIEDSTRIKALDSHAFKPDSILAEVITECK